MRFVPRVCFVLLLSVALGAVLGGAGCTHRGTPSVLPSGSPAGARTIYVSASTGNDKTGTGSSTAPYKTVTKALAVAASPGPVAVGDIEIAAGHYGLANGEKFPLIVSAGVTINGSLYGNGITKGTFIDGVGEDAAFEKAISAPSQSYFTAFEIAAKATQVSFTRVYIGTLQRKAPVAGAIYNAVDVLGSGSATAASIGTMQRGAPGLNGVLLGGGSFACTSCSIGGTDYAIAGLALGGGSASASGPTLTLTGPTGQGQGLIRGGIGIKTDGNVAVSASNQTFSSTEYAFADTYTPIGSGTGSGSPSAGVPVDFGQGSGNPQSSGGNVFIGAHKSEIDVTRNGDVVTAFSDTWNPHVQGSDGSGQYRVKVSFGPGAAGQNVTIASSATNAAVDVGPFQQPTPTPSPTSSASTSPSPSPSASPTQF